LSSAKLTHMGRSFDYEMPKIVGVTPDYVNTSITWLFKQTSGVAHFADGLDMSIAEMLYTPSGSQSGWVPTITQRLLDYQLEKKGFLNFKFDESNFDLRKSDGEIDDRTGAIDTSAFVGSFDLDSLLGNSTEVTSILPFFALNFLQQSPGIVFTDRPSRLPRAHVAVSLPTYQRMIRQVTGGSASSRFHDSTHSVQQVRMKKLLVKTNDGVSEDDMDMLIARLSALSSRTNVFDYRTQMESVETFQSIITYAGLFIAGMTTALSTFSLVSSMYANIRNQSAEIGVLLALGMSKFRIIRVYIHEAFVIVFSSVCCGTLTGTVVAWTMSLQQALLSGLPIPFYFPWEYLVFGFFIGWVSAFLASYLPAKRAVNTQIVSMLRGGKH